MALHIECRFNKNSLFQCYFLVILPTGVSSGVEHQKQSAIERNNHDVSKQLQGKSPCFPVFFLNLTLFFSDIRPFSIRAKSAALASSKYLNSQSTIKKELSAQADCATNFLQPIKLQERSSFFRCLLYTSPSPRDS